MKASDLHTLLCLAILNKLTVMIVGKPGVGKTAIGFQVTAAVRHKLILMHPSISDPTDFKGMPCIVNGVAMFLAFAELKDIVDATEPTVVLIDDVGQAAHAVQAALMQLILARRINDHKVSDHVVFVLATNDSSHRAGVHGILEPLKSRCDTIVHLEPDYDSWRDWAWKNGIEPMLINYFRFRPSQLCDFRPTAELTNSPSPRTAAAVDKWLKAIKNNDTLLRTAIEGAAGLGFATDFFAYLQVYRSLPDLNEIRKNPTTAPVPTDPATKYATVGAIVGATDKHSFQAFLIYAARMEKEFEVYYVSDVCRKDPNLVNTETFNKWSTKNTSFSLGIN